MKDNDITEKIIGCANNVHKALGPGLLESVYEEVIVNRALLALEE